MTRFEHATLALARRCSTTEPHPHISCEFYFINNAPLATRAFLASQDHSMEGPPLAGRAYLELMIGLEPTTY